MDESEKREDGKRWRFLWDLHSQRLKRLLDGDMRKALAWQQKQQEARESELDLEAETEFLLRAYLQVLEAEEKCERLANQRYQAEFWMLVRAAAEARALMEKIERQRATGGGFFAGVADAMEQRNARACAALSRGGDTDGGGEVGAALGLAPPPPARVMSDYDEMVAATRAARAAAKKPTRVITSEDDAEMSGPGGP